VSKNFKKGVSFQNYLEILGKKVKGNLSINKCEEKRDQQQKPTRYGTAPLEIHVATQDPKGGSSSMWLPRFLQINPSTHRPTNNEGKFKENQGSDKEKLAIVFEAKDESPRSKEMRKVVNEKVALSYEEVCKETGMEVDDLDFGDK